MLYSILIPVFLYPAMLFVFTSAVALIGLSSESRPSRIVLAGEVPAAHAELRKTLAETSGIEVDASVRSLREGTEGIREKRLDAVVEFLPPEPGGEELEENFRLRISYAGSEQRSRRARDRVDGVLADYRTEWIEREARALGVSAAEMERFRVARNDVSTEREISRFLFAQVLSLVVVFMVAIGAIYPAVDSTAGERERSTWETLMTVAASRGSVMGAKYLTVTTLALTAALLNMVTMTTMIGTVVGPILEQRGVTLSITATSLTVVVLLVAIVAMAMLLSAAMLVLASLARTFKQGQSMVMPVYLMALLPLIVAQDPDLTLKGGWALVPVLNVQLMVRGAIAEVFNWPAIGVTLLTTGALIALCLQAARMILHVEDLLLGSYGGSLWRFLKRSLPPRLGGKRRGRSAT